MAVPTATRDSSSREENGHDQGVQADPVPDSMEYRRSSSVSLEPRPLRPFTSEEEYLYAMKEDLAEWLKSLYEDVNVDVDQFFEALDTGVILCRHANRVLKGARETAPTQGNSPARPTWPRVSFREGVQPGTFRARDNVSQFISWCRGWLRVKECLLFETDDLVERKNERNVVLCLLEVARKGCDLCEDMPVPMLVQMEKEIDAEIARDERRSRCSPLRALRRPPSWLADAATMTTIESSDDGGNDDDSSHQDKHRPPQINLKSSQLPPQQIITNDLRSLHQRVADLLNRCSCPSQFPMLRVADGKYRIGDTQVLIFVRVLRNHVMVRVGGGWDTLEHYLEKHDPCRGRSGRRLTSSKTSSSSMKVHVSYQRPRSCGTPSSNRSSGGFQYSSPSPTPVGSNRRRSFDLSRLSSPDDRSVCSSSSRTPSRGSSPGCALDEDFPVQDDWNSANQNRPSSATGRRNRQLRTDGSSSEVSEEGTNTWRIQQRSKSKSSSPRKIMRYGNNGCDDSEPDSIFSSPPRSLDGFSKNHRNQKVFNQKRGPDSFSSFGSDDSAVSLDSGDGSVPPKLSSQSRYNNTDGSKIPKSSRRYQSSENLAYNMGQSLSSSRSETSLFASFNPPPSRNLHQQRGRKISASTHRLPRSNSGLSTTIAITMTNNKSSTSTSTMRRRSASASRTSFSTSSSPVKDRRPSAGSSYRISSTTSAASRRRSGTSSNASSRQTSPSKPVAPLLEEILHDSEMLDTDEKLLRRMERLINQYKAKAISTGNTSGTLSQEELEDLEFELTEDATICRSLSPDDDISLSLSSSFKAPNSLPILAANSSHRKVTTPSSKGGSLALSAKSPSKIPIFTAWHRN